MRRDSETLGQKTASRPEGKNRAQKSTVDTQGYREEKGMMEWWKIGVMEYWSVGERRIQEAEWKIEKTGRTSCPLTVIRDSFIVRQKG